jgi:hypothetical protein
MMTCMGQLIVGIREAEGRLAAIGRALQSAYEEEVREATFARDAAAQGVARAQAMETAARSLGQTEIMAKIAEIVISLRTAESTATQRLAELAALEKAVQLRLADTELTPGPAALPSAVSALVPPPPPSIPPAGPLSVPAMASMPPVANVSSTAPPFTPPPGNTPSLLNTTPVPDAPPESVSPAKDDLLARQAQLITRVEELDRVIRRWPREIARHGIQEHVALARLIGRRFEVMNRMAESRAEEVVDRLQGLAAMIGIEDILGFGDESADWARVAADSRQQRLALVEARKRNAAA